MTGVNANAEKFLDLLLQSGALKFGSFKTKSGRVSPYFFNTGSFDHGKILSEVAACYAELILSTFKGQDLHLYGPAYKGIPLCTSVAQAIAIRSKREIPFTFNRKEAKDHGEGGNFIGRALTSESKIVIVEDVMTGGTSVRETLDLLKPIGAKVISVVIGVDRQERGSGAAKAAEEVASKYGIPVYPILKLDEILALLWNKPRQGKVWVDDAVMQAADAYRKQYG